MKKHKYLLSGLALALLFIITYWWLFKDYDIEKCFEVISQINPLWALPAILLAFAYIAGEAANIRIGMGAFGSRFSVSKALQYAAIGFYFSSITPSASGGQPAQAYYMSNDDLPLSESAMVLLLTSVLFKVVLIFVGLPLVLIKSSLVFTGLPKFSFLFMLGVCFNILSALVLLFAMFSKQLIYRCVTLIIGLLLRLRIVKNEEKIKSKALSHIKGYRQAAVLVRQKPSISAKIFAVTLAQRAAMFSVAYCIYRAFGLNGLSWLDVVSIQAASSFAVDSLPFPGAVGVSEGAFLGLYGSIYGDNYLIPALVLTRGCTYYLPMAVTGVVTGYFHLKQMKRLDQNRLRLIKSKKKKGC